MIAKSNWNILSPPDRSHPKIGICTLCVHFVFHLIPLIVLNTIISATFSFSIPDIENALSIHEMSEWADLPGSARHQNKARVRIICHCILFFMLIGCLFSYDKLFSLLKECGVTTYKICEENIVSQAALTKMKNGEGMWTLAHLSALAVISNVSRVILWNTNPILKRLRN